MRKEFNFLKKRYNLKNLSLLFDNDALSGTDVEALYYPRGRCIIMKDRRVCRRRLLSLLHEIKHVIQDRCGELIIDFRSLKRMYFLEFEAEMFSINEYEKLYAKKHGTCLRERWTLASFEDYKKGWLC